MSFADNQRQLLILGAPRSGTSLLASCLGRHREIAMLNEDPFGVARRMVGRKFVGNKLCLPVHIRMEPVPAWLWWLTRPGRLKHLLLRTVLLFGAWPEPAYSKLSIEEYLAWPELTVIGIHRNPVDTIDSIQHRGGQSAPEAGRRWAEAIKTLHQLWSTVPDRISLVSFERFVAEPAPCLEALLARLELPFDPNCLDGYLYTPFYPGRPGIEPKRARTKSEESLGHWVFEQDTELTRMYNQIREHSV